MHDSLGYVAHDPIHRAVPPRPDDVLAGLRLLARTTCCRSATTRSCTARARCCARCPATGGSSSPTCAPTSPTCGRTPASSCSSWARSSARSRSGPRAASSTGGCSTTPTTAACSSLVRDLNRRLPRRPRRCGRATHDPAGFEWIDANDAGQQRVLASSAAARATRPTAAGVRRELLRRPARRLPARAARRPGDWDGGAQHRRRGLRRLRGRQPRRGHGGRGRAVTASRRPRRHRAAARDGLAASLLMRDHRGAPSSPTASSCRGRTAARDGSHVFTVVARRRRRGHRRLSEHSDGRGRLAWELRPVHRAGSTRPGRWALVVDYAFRAHAAPGRGAGRPRRRGRRSGSPPGRGCGARA